MTKRQISKVFGCIILMVSMALSLVACANKLEEDIEVAESQTAPPINQVSQEGLNFIELHNYVIDGLMSEETPFFYISNGSVSIDGDNEKKEISVACKTSDDATVNDLDLFLSMVLRLIGENASEQDFRFKGPVIDKYDNYTYTSFGTVFDTYSISFDCKRENGDVLRNDYVKAGSTIPVEPRYWRAE